MHDPYCPPLFSTAISACCAQFGAPQCSKDIDKLERVRCKVPRMMRTVAHGVRGGAERAGSAQSWEENGKGETL